MAHLNRGRSGDEIKSGAAIRGSGEGGARYSLCDPADQFYGERNAQVRDPPGHCWDLSMRIEEVSPEEMERRFKAMTNPELRIMR